MYTRLLVVCCICRVSFGLPTEFRAKRSTDPGLNDHVIAGDAVLVYYDVKTAIRCANRCMAHRTCSFYFYNKQAATCAICPQTCQNVTLVSSPGYRFYESDYVAETEAGKRVTNCPGQASLPVTFSPDTVCWLPVTERPLDYVSVGSLGVWALTLSTNIYYRKGTYENNTGLGDSWTLVEGHLVQIDVSSTLAAGVNNGGVAWTRNGIAKLSPTGTGWSSHGTPYTWFTLSPAGNVWMANAAGQLLYRGTSLSGPDTVVGEGVASMDAGPLGLWAVNQSGALLHRSGTYGDGLTSGNGWLHVPGSFKAVSTGRGVVAAVEQGGGVWVRTGVGLATAVLWPSGGRQTATKSSTPSCATDNRRSLLQRQRQRQQGGNSKQRGKGGRWAGEATSDQHSSPNPNNPKRELIN